MRWASGGVTAAQAGAAGLGAALANRLVTIVIVAIGAGYYMTARGEIRRVIGPQESGPTVGEQPSGSS